MSHLLSLPEDHWRQILSARVDQNPSCSNETSHKGPGESSTDLVLVSGEPSCGLLVLSSVLGLTVRSRLLSGRLFPPLTSPELNNFYKLSSQESVRDHLVNLGTTSSRT